MSSNASRAAPLCFLLEDGAFADEHAAPAKWSGGRDLALSRALCRFRLFRAGADVPKRQIESAARLFAETNAPFEDCGMLILRAPDGAAIWYWDQALIKAGDAVKARSIAPETLYRPAGEGWRILACAEGFEAQYWQDGALIASTWRRRPFTREQWAAFALDIDNADIRAPDQPPEPMRLPVDMSARWRRALVKPPWSWKDTENTSLTVAACALALSAFLAGGGWRHSEAASAATREATALEARISSDDAIKRARERLGLIADYRGASNDADVLGAVADTFEVLQQFDLNVEAWQIENGKLDVTVLGAVNEIPVRDVVAALEGKANLCAVTPVFQGRDDAVDITARLASATNGACPDANGGGS